MFLTHFFRQPRKPIVYCDSNYYNHNHNNDDDDDETFPSVSFGRELAIYHVYNNTSLYMAYVYVQSK